MERKVLKELVTYIIPGIPARNLKESDGSPAGVSCGIININNITGGEIDVTSIVRKTLSPGTLGKSSMEDYLLKEGDVVLCTRGSPFKAAMVDHISDCCVISPNLSAFRLHRSISPPIVVEYLNSTDGQQELKSISRGERYPFLYMRDVLELDVPVPSSGLQTKLLSYCNDVDVYISLLKKEESLLRDIRRHIIASALEVTP